MQFEYLKGRRENGPEAIFEVILDNNFQKLLRNIKPQILRRIISIDQDKHKESCMLAHRR